MCRWAMAEGYGETVAYFNADLSVCQYVGECLLTELQMNPTELSQHQPNSIHHNHVNAGGFSLNVKMLRSLHSV